MWMQRQNCQSFEQVEGEWEENDEDEQCSQDWGFMLQTQAASSAQVQSRLETQVYKWHSEDLLETQEYAFLGFCDMVKPQMHIAVPMAKAKGPQKGWLKRKGLQKAPSYIYINVYKYVPMYIYIYIYVLKV